MTSTNTFGSWGVNNSTYSFPKAPATSIFPNSGFNGFAPSMFQNQSQNQPQNQPQNQLPVQSQTPAVQSQFHSQHQIHQNNSQSVPNSPIAHTPLIQPLVQPLPIVQTQPLPIVQTQSLIRPLMVDQGTQTMPMEIVQPVPSTAINMFINNSNLRFDDSSKINFNIQPGQGLNIQIGNTMPSTGLIASVDSDPFFLAALDKWKRY